ncbi:MULTISPECIES: hypothetical protein [Priestia]|uniref:hypothetical protein n=1 Tax=Priestia TaxID=2800373 RepID=UPI00203F28C5|nr:MULTISPECIES: hypothetical protein [Priestia]MCM3768980.1 hypothetical protein [Priestia aryabhattai]MDY0943719.1 hypothetical protein [Priestia megaterium]
MLKFIEEGFLYGFILCISLALFTVPYKEVTVGEDLQETTYIDLSDFIIPLLRVGVVIALLGAVIGFFLYQHKKRAWIDSSKLFFLSINVIMLSNFIISI